MAAGEWNAAVAFKEPGCTHGCPGGPHYNVVPDASQWKLVRPLHQPLMCFVDSHAVKSQPAKRRCRRSPPQDFKMGLTFVDAPNLLESEIRLDATEPETPDATERETSDTMGEELHEAFTACFVD
jgi:hypothetical protein